jgi:hypothetical protein
MLFVRFQRQCKRVRHWRGRLRQDRRDDGHRHYLRLKWAVQPTRNRWRNCGRLVSRSPRSSTKRRQLRERRLVRPLALLVLPVHIMYHSCLLVQYSFFPLQSIAPKMEEGDAVSSEPKETADPVTPDYKQWKSMILTAWRVKTVLINFL